MLSADEISPSGPVVAVETTIRSTMKNLPIFSQWRSSVGPCLSWPIRLCLDRCVRSPFASMSKMGRFVGRKNLSWSAREFASS
eukprot:symbB.v1.2.022389.t1/scaffold1983.1/size166549/5